MKPLILALALLGTFGHAASQTATYAIDPSHTSVIWEALHFDTSTLRGRFDKKEGTVEFDRAGKTGKVDITIDMASVSTGVGPLNEHLKSQDFFDVAKHPTARFTASKLVFGGDKVTEVQGALTMLGKTGPVTLKANRFNCYMHPMLKREVCGGDFEATIQRSQWGSTYGLPGIPDTVRLIVQVEAVKQ